MAMKLFLSFLLLLSLSSSSQTTEFVASDPFAESEEFLSGSIIQINDRLIYCDRSNKKIDIRVFDQKTMKYLNPKAKTIHRSYETFAKVGDFVYLLFFEEDKSNDDINLLCDIYDPQKMDFIEKNKLILNLGNINISKGQLNIFGLRNGYLIYKRFKSETPNLVKYYFSVLDTSFKNIYSGNFEFKHDDPLSDHVNLALDSHFNIFAMMRSPEPRKMNKNLEKLKEDKILIARISADKLVKMITFELPGKELSQVQLLLDGQKELILFGTYSNEYNEIHPTHQGYFLSSLDENLTPKPYREGFYALPEPELPIKEKHRYYYSLSSFPNYKFSNMRALKDGSLLFCFEAKADFNTREDGKGHYLTYRGNIFVEKISPDGSYAWRTIVPRSQKIKTVNPMWDAYFYNPPTGPRCIYTDSENEINADEEDDANKVHIGDLKRLQLACIDFDEKGNFNKYILKNLRDLKLDFKSYNVREISDNTIIIKSPYRGKGGYILYRITN